MAGRPPTPTALKVIRGNPGKRALPKDEPKPVAVEPSKPENLTERATKEWNRMAPILMRMRVLTEADGVALGMLCNDIAELESVEGMVRDEGYLVTNKRSGAVHLHPLLSLRAELTARVTVGLREFGQTPAARTKVRSAVAAPTGNTFDLEARARTEAG